ncbi:MULTISPECIES: histidine kinase [unclassified Microbacterium]|uniref:histidine kinase n=1 Tax=unclassified Microbacterium TaxID=2609290 RepID=UPI00214BDC38|nr:MULTISPECIES: histidine kinase [unclassified Microbacterium]MCR2784880.1 histidine kinase [Microbacterium sp. zg.B96]MDL5352666.1 histidine kinase [Microbacterium sp. zg-YB36]WIM16419.1 histidine kinase [Microbacterium sp. zg-B96]
MFRELKPYQIVVDVVVAVLFAMVALPAEMVAGQNSSFGYNDLSAALVVLAMTSALAVRRFSPPLALGLAWSGAIVQMAFTRGPGFADVAIFAVLYATAAYGTRRVFWAGFASVIVGAVVIAWYLILPAADFAGAISTGVAVLIAALFGLGLSWTTGALVRTAIRARENRKAQVAAEAETVTEQERVRIARDMHDVVAHSLAVVIAQADGARYAAAANPQAATTALGTISTTARSALSDVRLLLTQLRHSQGEGPQPTIADLEELYAQVRAAGVDLRVTVHPMPPGEPPAAVQLAVYRILQEALTNAMRHGGRGPVQVWLAWHPGRVTLSVGNPLPEGASPSESAGRGHGLIGMRERAQLVGGHLDATAEGRAFVVRATLPIGAAA